MTPRKTLADILAEAEAAKARGEDAPGATPVPVDHAAETEAPQEAEFHAEAEAPAHEEPAPEPPVVEQPVVEESIVEEPVQAAPPSQPPTFRIPEPEPEAEAEPEPVAEQPYEPEPQPEFQREPEPEPVAYSEPEPEPEPITVARPDEPHTPDLYQKKPPTRRTPARGAPPPRQAPLRPAGMQPTQAPQQGLHQKPPKSKMFAPPVALLAIGPWAYIAAIEAANLDLPVPSEAAMTVAAATVVLLGIGIPYALYMLADKSRQVSTVALVVLGTIGALGTLEFARAPEQAAALAQIQPAPLEEEPEPVEEIAAAEPEPNIPVRIRQEAPSVDPRLVRAAQRALEESNGLRDRIIKAKSYGNGTLSPIWVKDDHSAELYKNLTATVFALTKKLVEANRTFPERLRTELRAEGCTPSEVNTLTNEHMSAIRFDLVMTVSRGEYEVARAYAELGRMLNGTGGPFGINRTTGEVTFQEAESAEKLGRLMAHMDKHRELADSAGVMLAQALRPQPAERVAAAPLVGD